jgi:hypothetical protein
VCSIQRVWLWSSQTSRSSGCIHIWPPSSGWKSKPSQKPAEGNKKPLFVPRLATLKMQETTKKLATFVYWFLLWLLFDSVDEVIMFPRNIGEIPPEYVVLVFAISSFRRRLSLSCHIPRLWKSINFEMPIFLCQYKYCFRTLSIVFSLTRKTSLFILQKNKFSGARPHTCEIFNNSMFS